VALLTHGVRVLPQGICGLLFATVLNVMVGLTPWVDNFMHMGGLIAGVVVGIALFAKTAYDERTGEERRTLSQETCALLAALLLIALAIAAAAAVSSTAVRDYFRRCSVCEHLNCVEAPWWSCCITQASGSCELLQLGQLGSNGSTTLVQATCNMTSGVFRRTCSTEEWCSYVPSDQRSAEAVCTIMCGSC